MTKEEGLIKILREMDKKRVEELDKNTKKVFDAVMKIANSRDRLLEEKQELIDYLKEEQDRLVRECSPIYEDGLGKTRLVNEDIYNEVSKILSKIEKSDK